MPRPKKGYEDDGNPDETGIPQGNEEPTGIPPEAERLIARAKVRQLMVMLLPQGFSPQKRAEKIEEGLALIFGRRVDEGR